MKCSCAIWSLFRGIGDHAWRPFWHRATDWFCRGGCVRHSIPFFRILPASILLSLAAGGKGITLTARTCSDVGCCPSCDQSSSRMHSPCRRSWLISPGKEFLYACHSGHDAYSVTRPTSCAASSPSACPMSRFPMPIGPTVCVTGSPTPPSPSAVRRVAASSSRRTGRRESRMPSGQNSPGRCAIAARASTSNE
jgi:hypothetical protein